MTNVSFSENAPSKGSVVGACVGCIGGVLVDPICFGPDPVGTEPEFVAFRSGLGLGFIVVGAGFVGFGAGFVGVGAGFVGVGAGFVGVGAGFVGVGAGFVGVWPAFNGDKRGSVVSVVSEDTVRSADTL